jgi:hypothetical protein
MLYHPDWSIRGHGRPNRSIDFTCFIFEGLRKALTLIRFSSNEADIVAFLLTRRLAKIIEKTQTHRDYE